MFDYYTVNLKILHSEFGLKFSDLIWKTVNQKSWNIIVYNYYNFIMLSIFLLTTLYIDDDYKSHL